MAVEGANKVARPGSAPTEIPLRGGNEAKESRKAQDTSGVAETAPPAVPTDLDETGQPTPLTPDQQRITRLELQVADLQKTNQRLADTEAAAVKKATKPGFMRALLEIFEFIGRWLSPFFNLLSLVFRVVRIAYKIVKAGFDFERAGINWKDEGVRALGDLLGIVFPPAGAIANSAMNILDPFDTQRNEGTKGRSQILGGVNEFIDKGVVKGNPFRNGFGTMVGTAKDAFEGARGLFGGGSEVGRSKETDFTPAVVNSTAF